MSEVITSLIKIEYEFFVISLFAFQLVTSDEVLVFYEKGNLSDLVERMKSENERTDANSLLNYHIQLVHLLAMCTEGKNASTEIKCHSLIGLDDLVLIVTHPDCIPEVCIN
jgi:inositol 1,4,5-triphosphate receptor type 1